jgi:hypothetical protein
MDSIFFSAYAYFEEMGENYGNYNVIYKIRSAVNVTSKTTCNRIPI